MVVGTLTAVLFGLGLTNGSTTADAATEPGLTGKRIVIDAGHGGRDGGAEAADGFKEKVVTLATAKDVAQLLRQAGATVYLTRDRDTDLTTAADHGHRQRSSLHARTVATNAKAPDAFVSIHCNGAPSPVWRGAHVIYQQDNESGQALAATMQTVFKGLLLPTDRDIDATRSLYLLKHIPGSSVLAEVGFLTNPAEAAALRTPAYQQQVAFAIYAALLQYFGEPEVPEVHKTPDPHVSAYGQRADEPDPKRETAAVGLRW